MAERSQRAALVIPEEVLVHAAIKYLEMNAALPADAQVRHVGHDIRRLGWIVVLTSESFVSIPDSEESPVLNDIMRQQRCPWEYEEGRP